MGRARLLVVLSCAVWLSTAAPTDHPGSQSVEDTLASLRKSPGATTLLRTLGDLADLVLPHNASLRLSSDPSLASGVVHNGAELSKATATMLGSIASEPLVAAVLSVVGAKGPATQPHHVATRPLAPASLGQDDPDLLWLLAKFNTAMQVFSTFVCKGLHVWAHCSSPIRAVFCNPVVWWSREIVLDYECLNPCACDAYRDTLEPIPGCLNCDFPGRVPPSPATSWFAFNRAPIQHNNLPLDFLRCSLLRDEHVVKCPEETRKKAGVREDAVGANAGVDEQADEIP